LSSEGNFEEELEGNFEEELEENSEGNFEGNQAEGEFGGEPRWGVDRAAGSP
jgi:hypothetical protein